VGASASKTTVTFADERDLASRQTLSSDARTTALVLRAIVAVEPSHPMLPKVVRGLLSLRRDGRFPDTQSSAWAIAALDDARPLFAPRAATGAASLYFDDHRVSTARFVGAPGGEAVAGHLAIGRLLGAPGAELAFVPDGRPIYYEAALKFSRRDPATAPSDHGITVARRFQRLERNGTFSDPGVLHVGDYVVEEVLIANESARDLVVLDDPIPAGFEAVNTSFANTERTFLDDPAKHLVTHRELRDDRVVTFFDELPSGVRRTRYLLRVIAAGRFVQPPARAECMYTPDVYGRTATGWVETR
jgi:uncharacterized protein YfaS (alpha-2-macroglobulin family)